MFGKIWVKFVINDLVTVYIVDNPIPHNYPYHTTVVLMSIVGAGISVASRHTWTVNFLWKWQGIVGVLCETTVYCKFGNIAFSVLKCLIRHCLVFLEFLPIDWSIIPAHTKPIRSLVSAMFGSQGSCDCCLTSSHFHPDQYSIIQTI